MADPRAMFLARQASGDGKSSSFDMDRAEGGQSLVSAELRERLEQHGAADVPTLQFLWDMNIWSSADLAGVDAEALVEVRPNTLFGTWHPWEIPDRNLGATAQGGEGDCVHRYRLSPL